MKKEYCVAWIVLATLLLLSYNVVSVDCKEIDETFSFAPNSVVPSPSDDHHGNATTTNQTWPIMCRYPFMIVESQNHHVCRPIVDVFHAQQFRNVIIVLTIAFFLFTIHTLIKSSMGNILLKSFFGPQRCILWCIMIAVLICFVLLVAFAADPFGLYGLFGFYKANLLYRLLRDNLAFHLMLIYWFINVDHQIGVIQFILKTKSSRFLISFVYVAVVLVFMCMRPLLWPPNFQIIDEIPQCVAIVSVLVVLGRFQTVYKSLKTYVADEEQLPMGRTVNMELRKAMVARIDHRLSVFRTWAYGTIILCLTTILADFVPTDWPLFFFAIVFRVGIRLLLTFMLTHIISTTLNPMYKPMFCNSLGIVMSRNYVITHVDKNTLSTLDETEGEEKPFVCVPFENPLIFSHIILEERKEGL